MWLVEHDSDAAAQQQPSCPLNQYKQRCSIYVISLWHTFTLKAEKLQCKNMSPVSEMPFIFKCQAAPVFHSSPLFPPTGKCPEPVYHIFRSPALMKELHSGRRKKETEIESSQGGFREQLLASDVTAGPSRCRPHHLCTMPMSLQHVNCVMMNNTKPE